MVTKKKNFVLLDCSVLWKRKYLNKKDNRMQDRSQKRNTTGLRIKTESEKDSDQ